MSKFEHRHPKFGGRRKGTPNRASMLGREQAQNALLSKKYLKQLVKRILAGEAPPGLESLMWAYAYGKPLDPNRFGGVPPRVPVDKEVAQDAEDDDEDDDEEDDCDDDDLDDDDEEDSDISPS